VLKELADMKFTAVVPTMNALRDAVMAGIRPGLGFIGNASEEEALYKKSITI
jgi:hypothetical protein